MESLLTYSPPKKEKEDKARNRSEFEKESMDNLSDVLKKMKVSPEKSLPLSPFQNSSRLKQISPISKLNISSQLSPIKFSFIFSANNINKLEVSVAKNLESILNELENEVVEENVDEVSFRSFQFFYCVRLNIKATKEKK